MMEKEALDVSNIASFDHESQMADKFKNQKRDQT